MKIYTKTGDTGETGLIGGLRVPKHDPLIEAIGDIDELNAAIGMLHTIHTNTHSPLLQKIQHSLFIIGARLATLRTDVIPSLELEKTALQSLEDWIDEMDKTLPALTQFILPGGHAGAAHAFLVRAICRRAERRMSLLLEEKGGYLDTSFQYLNRLSDALFTYARHINHETNTQEIPWIK